MESVADTFKTRLDEQRIPVADLLCAETFLDLLTECLLGVGGRFGGVLPLLPWTASQHAQIEGELHGVTGALRAVDTLVDVAEAGTLPGGA
nr:hypothetical protein OG781_06980 [Streptomyces sp. NBC_00830]